MNAASLSQKNRIAGGLIDRGKPLSFRFDGQHYTGFSGDTLASALLANNVRLVGRSFKYHRPRGILTAGSEEPNALVTIGSGASKIQIVVPPPPSFSMVLRQKARPKLGFYRLTLWRSMICYRQFLGLDFTIRHLCGQRPFGKSYTNR